jgi:hypothetical protein
VPHAEMADRQKTGKYVTAAKLANQGFSIDQISQKVDLSTAEIEMITKMNREELQFAEESLPAWVQAAAHSGEGQHGSEPRSQELADFASQLQKMNQMNQMMSTAFETAKPDMTSMNMIKQEFTDTLAQNSTHIPQTFLQDEKRAEAVTVTQNGKTVRPFEFRKIVK